MSNVTLTVKEDDIPGTLTDVTVLGLTRQDAANSKSLALCNEDKLVLDAMKAALEIIDNAMETSRYAVNLIASQAGITANAGAVAANTPRITLASNDPAVTALEKIDDPVETGRFAVNLIASQAGIDAGAGIVSPKTPRITHASDDPMLAAVVGVANDTSAALVNPSLLGVYALSHGANPTAVTAGNAARLHGNRHGVPWVIGGHPNIVVRSNRITDADGAQTNASLSGAIATGNRVVVTQVWVKADKNNTGSVAVKIGFGASAVPTPALAGVAGLIIDSDFGAGEGHQIGVGSGIVAIGGDDEELRLTCDDPAGGQLTVGYSYYTIES